ncbi:MAG: amylo-alpha-1,6-glucosidase [Gemmatimonadaceae bacterium]
MANPRGVGNAANGGRVIRAPRLDLPVLSVSCPPHDPRALIEHEWLVTNGLGGYSSGTVAGVVTRRYHGMLVAALRNPLGRMIMLNAVDDDLDVEMVREFRLEGGIPVWRFETDGAVIEKSVGMPYRQNTVVIRYKLLEGPAREIRLSPAVHFRGYEAPVTEPLGDDYKFASNGHHFRLTSGHGAELGLPPLCLSVEGRGAFELQERRREQVLFPVEEARGYGGHGALWSPGAFTVELKAGESMALIASTESDDVMTSMTASDVFSFERERKRRLLQSAAEPARTDRGAQLVLAADQFIIHPVGRVRDSMRAIAVGEQLRTIIAGYHWFTDWGRDTMISLEGLTLTTGRHREAGFVLRTFAQYVRDGLIPNFFPDGNDEGLYHTADATLWFFHAIHRYAEVTEYWEFVEDVLPVMRGIVEHHVNGTRFGIGVDPRDGLLRQGAEGYQLTWMDAKVEDWVVTPRRGKAVEINALWYHALRLIEKWECDFGDRDQSNRYRERAERVRESFNRRFWNDETGHLFDVVDGPEGDDAACRPNQLLAISLPNAILDESRWGDVLDVVHKKLLTPVGLRSLSPDHRDFKAKYFGDLRARDAAYHQGTVWGWLIGPWIDAWLKVHPDDRAGARRFLEGFLAHMPAFGVGSIAEVFDAGPPYTPRGCIAQAWSVAEVLRCWAKTATESSSSPASP